MPLTQTKLFKVLPGPVMLLSCLLILHDSYRATARVLLLVLLISYVHFLWTSKTRWMRLIFVGFLVATFLPIDVTLQNYPGPPRFVPLIMGSPRAEDIAREERGEVVLGGCILRENPPQWVLVW
jgi:hypothetical protein